MVFLTPHSLSDHFTRFYSAVVVWCLFDWTVFIIRIHSMDTYIVHSHSHLPTFMIHMNDKWEQLQVCRDSICSVLHLLEIGKSWDVTICTLWICSLLHFSACALMELNIHYTHTQKINELSFQQQLVVIFSNFTHFHSIPEQLHWTGVKVTVAAMCVYDRIHSHSQYTP